MKYVKILGLAAVAALALMAFVGAGTASATKLCTTNVATCPAGEQYTNGTAIKSSLVNTATLETTTGIVRDNCTSSEVAGKITEEEVVKGNIEKLTFGSCTSTTKVLSQSGTLTVNSSGTVSGTGTETTVVILGESCIYGLGTGTTIGTFTGGEPAHITANAVLNVLAGSGNNCPSTARWTATYAVTSPTKAWVTN